MACKSCTETSYTSGFYGPYPDCKSYVCSDECLQVIDTSCVVYTGPQLVNLDLGTNICLETILQKIDEDLSVITGNYAGYNTFCLAPIQTEKEFVEAISQFVCEFKEDYDEFVGTTFPNYQTQIQDEIDAINNPNMATSCAAVGIIGTDSLQTVLQKLSVGECTLFSMLDLSTANWNTCFTIVGVPPTTPLEATNALLQQICSIKEAQGDPLPVFDNTNTCLTGGTVNDTTEETILLMRNRLCQSPIFDINALTFGCITKPSTNTLDLQGTIQSILTKLDAITKAFPTFNPTQFTSTFVNPLNQCLGVQISLTNPGSGSGTDRLVAATATDSNPGTLIDKLVEGTGINLDFTNPEQCVISISPSFQPVDEKVKASSTDPTAGFLDQKIKATGQPSLGLTMGSSFDPGDNKVNISTTINPTTLAQAILEAIQDDTDLQAIFCALVNACPVACVPPSNVSVSFQ